MHDKYSISIVIPVYNESIILERSVIKIDAFLSKHFKDYEILIIESGSTDGSYEICDRLAEQIPAVKVIHEGKRNGFGAALKLGFKTAVKDIVTSITVDLAFPIDTILEALPFLTDYDCILSYRSRDNRTSIFRKFQSFSYNSLIRFLLGVRVKHINSAFKMYKRGFIQGLSLVSNGWFIDAEIIYWITAKKVKYTEIPAEFIERTNGKSSVTLSSPVSVLKELHYFLKTLKGRGKL